MKTFRRVRSITLMILIFCVAMVSDSLISQNLPNVTMSEFAKSETPGITTRVHDLRIYSGYYDTVKKCEKQGTALVFSDGWGFEREIPISKVVSSNTVSHALAVARVTRGKMTRFQVRVFKANAILQTSPVLKENDALDKWKFLFEAQLEAGDIILVFPNGINM